MFRQSALGAVLAASLLGLGAPAANAQVYVSIAPPAPRYEVAPAPRRGHVWVPGHYQWRNNQYVWITGHWQVQRPGYAYVPPRWVQRSSGQWYLTGNTWQRGGAYGDRDLDGIANVFDQDRDGDGVPNRYDRDNRRRFGTYGDLDRDGIANHRDRDIDGDGVRNARDSRPFNPRVS
jgi:hypothetical protein